MEVLLARKRVFKANVTRLETTLNNIQVGDASTSRVHGEKVEQLFIDLDKLLHDISATSRDDDEFEHYETEINDIYNRLVAVKVKLTNLAVNLAGPTVSTSTEGRPRANEVRLPKLQLPSFDGNVQTWLSFKDLFEAAVHNNDSLSGAEKLQYLKGLLQGEAAALLRSIPVTNANYIEAWELLISRYQNKREIINSILKRMFSQPAIHQESASALRKLLDTTLECTRSLKVLGEPVDQWDSVLVFHTTEKLDGESRRQWELSLITKEPPTFQELESFLEHRARALAAVTIPKSRVSTTSSTNSSRPSQNYTSSHSVSVAQQVQPCLKCAGSHLLSKCPEFINATVSDRCSFVKGKSLCFNCLRSSHSSKYCNSGKCHKCNKRHHTLLHFMESINPNGQTNVAGATEPTVTSHYSSESVSTTVLLSTAIINVRDMQGVVRPVRALLDSASEASFVTENCVQKLGLRAQSTKVCVSGLGSSSVKCRGMVELNFTSTVQSEDTFNVLALILPKVTGNLPRYQVKKDNSWSHLIGLDLADPTYNVPGCVDVLLGADVYSMLMRSGRCSGITGSPIALETALGWVLSGPISARSQTSVVTTLHAQCDVDLTLRRFWELEEIPNANLLTPEEKRCERLFEESHTRNKSGRFVVELPFQETSPELGLSRNQSIQRLCSMERRLKDQPDKRQQYEQFMSEYLSLGHMELIPVDQVKKSSTEVYYIPHHAVIKESSSTTKLRVVFDASAKTSSGVSLNDKLMVGPKLQDDIVSILIRFRTHIVPLVADIAKMYRQVQVNNSHTDYQRIVWRNSPADPIQDFRLLTVTYGESCSPYLATKCLQQLAMDEKQVYPKAASVVLRDFYVDDLMSGADNIAEALELQNQLIQLLKKGGFELRKWLSSVPAILEAVPESMREINVPLSIDEDKSVNTLGLQWHPASDQFSFSVNQPSSRKIITKRTLLSDLAKVFDPLGWLSPVIVTAKLLFQSLWRLNIDWDDALPDVICNDWRKYCQELPYIEEIRIDRCIVAHQPTMLQLVGFCDASELAYGAVVYLRTLYSDGSVLVKLVAGKTKVSPVRQISIPRLELCGAVLLAKLAVLVQNALCVKLENVLLWTDSTIVLAWLAAHPKRWQTFVANRVAVIQELVPSNQWFHVISSDNPADCASRGLTPAALCNQSLWWTGPTWLQEAVLPHSSGEAPDQQTLESEEKKAIVTSAHTRLDVSLLDKWSSLSRLQRVTAWCLRFISNCKIARERRVLQCLTPFELNNALFRWVAIIQMEAFRSEIHCLKNGKSLPPSCRLVPLNPFLDENGILRVGGRLQNAQVKEEQKHPALLPHHNRLTELIVMHEHLKNLHAGPQLVQALLQQRFWIVRGRDVIRYHLRKCVICHRHNKSTSNQLMGQLPAARVRPARPFLHSGVDYAGPILLRNMKGRSQITYKGYIALFVCFSTKAIHVELVSDLSTSAFIAALRRFVSRRGRPLEMYSDCGTNFVGASRELRESLEFIKNVEHQQTVENHLTDQGIKWFFNSPAAPHQGGLWEAGVKSVKHHLRRIVGKTILNFEEMNTVLTQIEACLNSRPLTAISADPNDLAVLTPGHFLTGDSLLAVPQPDLLSSKVNRLSRWQLQQQLVQHFWRRWSSEYLSRLQQRPKWWSKHENIQVGDMVLLKEENLPPLHWKLGRVVETYPGQDGLVRSVSVRTSSGVLKRPIVKLSRLPFNASVNDE